MMLSRALTSLLALVLMLIPVAPAAAQPRGTASQKGSLLIYSAVELRWDALGNLRQDTFLTLMNDYDEDVDLLVYYVNGDAPLPPDSVPGERAHPGWNSITVAMSLTGDEPTYWSVLTGQPKGLAPFTTLDPGFPPGRPDPDGSGDRVLRGFVYVWAVNADDQQIRWNHLSGSATIVNYGDGTVWEYEPTAHQVVAPVANGAPAGPAGSIALDGVTYEPASDQLFFPFQAVGSTAFSGPAFVTSDADLTLHLVSADLRLASSGPITTKANFVIWNANEFQFSGQARCITCWDQTLLSNYAFMGLNEFLIGFIQTDQGKARIDGVASQVCNLDFDPGDGLPLGADPRDVVSQDAAIQGVSTRLLTFDGGPPKTSGTNLLGLGTQNALVQFDTFPGPPPESSGGGEDAGDGASAGVQPERASFTKKGSLLVYPAIELRWDSAGFLHQDTFVTLVNDYPEDVTILGYYVNGDAPLPFDPGTGERAHPGWNHVDFQLELTANQPTYWSALTGLPATGGLPPLTTLDPGFPPGRPATDGSNDRVLRGFLYVWAVDAEGREIRWNHLGGEATVVNYARMTVREYNAMAHTVVSGVFHGAPTATPGVLSLDGSEYAAPYDKLVFDFQAAGSSSLSGPRLVVGDTELTLQALSADLRQDSIGPVTTGVLFEVWNMNEFRFTNTVRCATCWDQTLLSQYDAPNFFILQNLQTDYGRARLDGIQTPACDVDFDAGDQLPLGADPRDVVSRNAALLSVSSHLVTFDGGADLGASAAPLVGMGVEPAVVRYDSLSACPTDIDGNGSTGFSDLLAVLGVWGSCPACPEDFDGDDTVGFSDLLILLNAWGPCPTGGPPPP